MNVVLTYCVEGVRNTGRMEASQAEGDVMG